MGIIKDLNEARPASMKSVNEAGPDLLHALENIFEVFDLSPDSSKEKHAIDLAVFAILKAKQDMFTEEDLKELVKRPA